MIQIEKDINNIQGLCVITPKIYQDNRGYFLETYSLKDCPINFVQDNESFSTKKVLRGLHYQKQYPQTKLVRVVKGEIYDVAVDLRKNSATYGQWYGLILSGENKKQFLIPKGFAHGFQVLSDEVIFCYKCDDFYHPNDEAGIIWNDPILNIPWPLNNPILSEKDKAWLNFKDIENNLTF